MKLFSFPSGYDVLTELEIVSDDEYKNPTDTDANEEKKELIKNENELVKEQHKKERVEKAKSHEEFLVLLKALEEQCERHYKERKEQRERHYKEENKQREETQTNTVDLLAQIMAKLETRNNIVPTDTIRNDNKIDNRNNESSAHVSITTKNKDTNHTKDMDVHTLEEIPDTSVSATCTTNISPSTDNTMTQNSFEDGSMEMVSKAILKQPSSPPSYKKEWKVFGDHPV